MKVLIFTFSLLLLLGCSDNLNKAVPECKTTHLESYHCWPYNVEVYSIDNLNMDSSFYSYPLRSFFDEKYQITNWKKYSEIDTNLWLGMTKTLKECDDNQEIYIQINKRNEIFYSGSFKYLQRIDRKKLRSYEKVLFLDTNLNKLHVFTNINKVF